MEKLHRYTDRLPSLRLDTRAYNTIITAACHHGNDKEDTRKHACLVQDIFERMLEQSAVGAEDCTPDEQTYNLLLQINAKAGNLSKVMEILDLPALASEASQTKAIMISPETSTLLLEACVSSTSSLEPANHVNAAGLAERVLQQMNRFGRKPSTRHYSLAIQCWAKSGHEQQHQSTDRIEAILLEMNQSSKKPRRF
jgi:hypothetical protein